ncbi:sigma-54 interaction domain-containing protein [Erythrobacter sp. GH1-10]|uniref:sigma-54 interaction domain-containing protein n=1 Tax=Erythrobacter sp. GH1-10 TaxID=3349334 RepID=UPI003877C037
MPAMGRGGQELIGSSEPMEDLRAYIPKVALCDASVLIQGETGTGKERVAALIHELGPRRDKPFVALNSAALPEHLVESEFFGHEKGAFTGAFASHRGKFEQADGGTLFLDEIGEMSMATQAKLLRALETGEVTPLGGTRTKRVDVRIVAATNEDLEERVEQGSFRADLLYRINVARVWVAPLRQRACDIGPILSHFIARLNTRYHRHVERPDAKLMEALSEYDWPGNVRELRNFAEALFIDPPENRPVCISDIPMGYRRLIKGHVKKAPPEREQIMDALEETRWNKAQAARKLNWSRMTLYRKLDKYRIEDRDPPEDM